MSDNNQVVREIMEEQLRLPRPSSCPEEIYNDIMMDKCWKELPEDRYSFSQLLPLLSECNVGETKRDNNNRNSIDENYHTLNNDIN